MTAWLFEGKMADDLERSTRETSGNSSTQTTDMASPSPSTGQENIEVIYEEIHKCVKAIFEKKSSSSTTEGVKPAERSEVLQPRMHSDLRSILSEVVNLVNHDRPSRQYSYYPDQYTHASITSQVLASYLSLLDDKQLNKLSACVRSDCSHWLSKLFGYENALASFHDHRWEGLARVCRLALLLKYPKYGTEGFTALYTRPPVIYISTAAAVGLGQYLCSQLGLPQSSICKVPCNTVFGSRHSIDITAFERLFHDDVSCGKTPLLLVAYAGTPLAGHTDNLGRLRELCTQNGLWLHLEGDNIGALSLQSIPPSLKSATACDSMTLNVAKWFGLPGVPFSTFFRAKDPILAKASGLTRPESPERLSILPLWMSIQNIGLDKMREMILNAAQLVQQLCLRVDSIPSLKRIAQPHCTSLMAVFRYKAAPSSSSQASNAESQEESGADDDQDDADVTLSTQSSQSEGGELPPSVQDAMNQRLADQLAEAAPCVVLDVIDLPKEGCCLQFSPILSARVSGTTSDHIDDFVSFLKKQVASMDALLLAQLAVKSSLEGKEHIIIIEAEDPTTVVALICFPQYWQTKTIEGLSEAKKMELNNLNRAVLQKISEANPDVFTLGTTATGLMYISLNKVAPFGTISELVDLVCKTAEELADSSKFFEQMAEMVQRGIEAAQEDLHKDAESRLMEEGILRQVPIVSSLVNWWSPPPKETGIKGRSFSLSSGHLETTEKTYKFHIQVQDEDEGSLLPTPPRTPVSKTPQKNSPNDMPSPPVGGS